MSRELTYAEAVREAMDIAMERDPRVFLFGEDVGVYGGAFGVSDGLFQKYGPERVRDTPISEAVIAGVATGALKPGMIKVWPTSNVAPLRPLACIMATAATPKRCPMANISSPHATV